MSAMKNYLMDQIDALSAASGYPAAFLLDMWNECMNNGGSWRDLRAGLVNWYQTDAKSSRGGEVNGWLSDLGRYCAVSLRLFAGDGRNKSRIYPHGCAFKKVRIPTTAATTDAIHEITAIFRFLKSFFS